MQGAEKHTFVFEPSFDHVEKFLKLYQNLHATQLDQILQLEVKNEYWTATPGYPNIKRNCWLTLKYAVDQIERAYKGEKSKVQIVVECNGVTP